MCAQWPYTHSVAWFGNIDTLLFCTTIAREEDELLRQRYEQQLEGLPAHAPPAAATARTELGRERDRRCCGGAWLLSVAGAPVFLFQN